MKNISKRVLSLVLALALVLSLSLTAVAAPDSEVLTRGEAADMILEAAGDYAAELTVSDFLQGDDKGDLRLDKPVTHAEALTMLSRAFGKLPEVKGNNARLSAFDDVYANVPAWAQESVTALQNAGILLGSAEGLVGANSNMTAAELQTLLGRVYRLMGTRAEDEFYEYVNKEWLDSAKFPEGQLSSGTLAEIGIETRATLEKILDDLSKKTYAKGTKEQFVSDFYKAALDMTARNKDGTAPLDKYFALIDEAKTLQELLETDNVLREELGFMNFYFFSVGAAFEDSNAKEKYFNSIGVSLAKEDYANDNPARVLPYIKLMTDYQMLAGISEADAKAGAEAVYAMEKAIAAASLSPNELGDLSKSYLPFNLKELDEMFDEADMTALAESSGIKVGEKDIIRIPDPNAAEAAASFLKEENLDMLKQYAKISLLMGHGSLLSEGFLNAANEYNKAALGLETPVTVKQRAVNLTLGLMGEYVSQIYVDQVASKKAKEDVTVMISEFIAVYKERLQNADWMTAATREKAIKKLDTLTVKVGWPDEWANPLKSGDILPYSEGGSVLANNAAVAVAAVNQMIETQDEPVDKSEWGMTPYTVNAYYNPQYNEIVIPSGIMLPPVYDEKASRSANLGALGVIIAHEISHAFDDSGAQFDELGNATDWWTAEDYARFAEKCEEVAAFYDGIEIAPGVNSSGVLTLGENIADLGGVSCALQVAQQDDDFDAEAFFESYARLWKSILPRNYVELLNMLDVHSADRVRVNRTLQSIDLFFETYNITEGDGMYVPESERVSLW